MKPRLCILGTVLLLGMGLSVSEAGEGRERGAYVILTNLAEDDGYFEAVTKLKGIHPEAQVLSFREGPLESVTAELHKRAPRYVAVVLKPGDIDVNFQSRLLQICTTVDDDPFCDFSFGYITGTTAAEAAGFVENIGKAWKEGLPKKMMEMPMTGGPSRRSEGTALRTYGVDWKMVHLSYGMTNKKEMTDAKATARMKEHLSDYAGCGIIIMGGHGSPKGIHGSISGAGIREAKPNLSPAVIYNYACMTGCVSRAYQWFERNEDWSTIKAKTVAPLESMALSILGAGASAYIASLEPRPAGPGMHGELEYALASGETLGEVRKREYDMLVLGFLGWKEKGLVAPRYVDGKRHKTVKNAVRDIMMRDASGAVLFGDPAFRLGKKTRDLTTAAWTPKGEAFELDWTRNVDSWLQAFDPYWEWGDRMAGRAYACVTLPAGLKSIGTIQVLAVTDPQGGAVKHGHLTWGLETIDGEKRLHIKVNGKLQSLMAKGTKVKFRIYPQGVEPEAVPKVKEAEKTEKGEGGSPVEKALSVQWKLGDRPQKATDLLRFIENFVKKWGEEDHRLAFVFSLDAAEPLGKTVRVNWGETGIPLKKVLEQICRQLNLAYRVDAERNEIRFSAGKVGKTVEKPKEEKPAKARAEAEGDLLRAVQNGDLAGVKGLVEGGANLQWRSAEGESLLHVAVRRGHAEVAGYLIQQGIDVNVTNPNGNTPLYIAAGKGEREIVELLLKRRANVRVREKICGDTPLFAAAWAKSVEAMELLVKAGADVKTVDRWGFTPLCRAIENGGGEKAVKFLLEKGAEVNTRDKYRGQSPLHWAARTGEVEVVRMLLEKGADRNAKDDESRTPFDIAKAEGHEEAAKLLEAKDGK
ncbi:MAG: ankyrin repeat domain-containing protein [Planctomycetota bacterium]|jgi:ankyrin repeat protein